MIVEPTYFVRCDWFSSMTHLGDYPIRHRPSMDPGYRAGRVAALREDGGAEGSDGVGDELEALGVGRWGPGEEAHQELVGRRAVEPPLKVGGEDPLHRDGVSRPQSLVQGDDHPFSFLQSFPGRVSQFLEGEPTRRE